MTGTKEAILGLRIFGESSKKREKVGVVVCDNKRKNSAYVNNNEKRGKQNRKKTNWSFLFYSKNNFIL